MADSVANDMSEEQRRAADADLDRIIFWALGRVRIHLERHGARLLQAGGEIGDLFVSVEEAQQVLSGRPRAEIAHRLGLEPGPPPPLGPLLGPAAQLRTRFGLDPLEQRLLLAAAAPHVDIDVARLYTFAWADFTQKAPTVGFLSELVVDAPADLRRAQRALRPGGRLVGSGLLRFPDLAQAGRPSVHQVVEVPGFVLGFLRGEPPHLPRGLGARLVRSEPDRPPRPGAPLQRLAALLARPASRIVLWGDDGSGRRRAFHRLLAERSAPVIELTLDWLPASKGERRAALDEVVRHARLLGAVLLARIGRVESEVVTEGPLVDLLDRLRGHAGPVALAASGPPAAMVRTLSDFTPVRFPHPSPLDQRRLWRHKLAGAGIDDPSLADALARRFDLTPGSIERALADGLDEAALDGVPATVRHFDDAVRRRTQHTLDLYAELMNTTLDWRDVVLPPDVMAVLEELRGQARHRLQVFEAWGFARKMPYGVGLACMFTGPPGTGKTMMAGILARDLDRPLYRVDLSRVVSKWVGETEKNLARIFEEARKARVILLFDEADSLFAKRTEIRGSNDRFANMEVNFLLQKMEQYEGMTILTTNFERSIDDAFKRRLRFRVHFPMPDEAERAALWDRLIPPEMPREGDIDFEWLARKHKLSGGHIRNAVLRAAFFAADAGSGLSNELLHKAARAEAREAGRL